MAAASAKSAPHATDSLIEIRSTPYTGEEVARGVFAKWRILKGTLIEAAHCIKIPAPEYREHLRYSVFEHYLFHGKGGNMLLALGAGSLYNHSARPSLDYRVDDPAQVIRFYAARDLEPGDELTIFYGAKLWFKDSNAQQAQHETPLHDHLDDADQFLGAIEL